MVSNALYANVLIISLAIKLEGLVMQSAKLMVTTYLLLVTGQLQNYKIFAEHVRFYLRIVFEAAGGAVEEFLFVIDDQEALFADCMAAVEVAWTLFLGVIEVVAHGALHFVIFKRTIINLIQSSLSPPT